MHYYNTLRKLSKMHSICNLISVTWSIDICKLHLVQLSWIHICVGNIHQVWEKKTKLHKIEKKNTKRTQCSISTFNLLNSVVATVSASEAGKHLTPHSQVRNVHQTHLLNCPVRDGLSAPSPHIWSCSFFFFDTCR